MKKEVVEYNDKCLECQKVKVEHATTINMYQSDFKDIILEDEKSDLQYMELVAKLQQGNLQQKIEDYKLGNDEILRYRRRIYIPNSKELKTIILKEMHNVLYVGNPWYQKTIETIKS
jgi:hypothetical protein